MRKVNVVVMTVAGLLLIVASILKFAEMLAICIPSWVDNKYGFWESYEFFLIQIPLEFALGVWMVSGLFRKAAWIAGTLAYLGFIFVTIFKVITGAESCGCFGQIHVNPWITLFAIDVPFFLLLAIFRPKGLKLLPPPWPNVFYILAVAVPTIGLMVLSTPALVALRKPCLKPQQVQPDEAAQKALQEYLQKQREAKEKQQQDAAAQPEPAKPIAQVSAISAAAGALSLGKLNIESAGVNDLYTVRIDHKQGFSINTADPDKILLVPMFPDRQKIVVLRNGIEMQWASEGGVVLEVATDPNAAATSAQTLSSTNGQSEIRDRSSEFRDGMPFVPVVVGDRPGGSSSEGATESRSGGTGGDTALQDAGDQADGAAEPNGLSTMGAAEGQYYVQTAVEDVDSEPNTNDPNSDPNTVDPNSTNDTENASGSGSAGTGTQTNGSPAADPNTQDTGNTDQMGQWEWMGHVVEENVRTELAMGLDIVLMYHHDCPICEEVVPNYSKLCQKMTSEGNDEFKITFLAIPPYGENGPVPQDNTCLTGKLTDQQDWQIMSPYVIGLLDGQLVKTWPQGTAPEPDKIIDELFGETPQP